MSPTNPSQKPQIRTDVGWQDTEKEYEVIAKPGTDWILELRSGKLKIKLNKENMNKVVLYNIPLFMVNNLGNSKEVLF